VSDNSLMNYHKFCATDYQTRISEVNEMTKPKVKLATKKDATSKSMSNTKVTKAIASIAKKPVLKEPENNKAKVKKAMVKKTAALATKPNQAKAPAVKKATILSKEKKASTILNIMPKTTPEERYRMVETAAYFIAEQHGFKGRCDEHWEAAEREIAGKLGS
jgi:hypothetical protein